MVYFGRERKTLSLTLLHLAHLVLIIRSLLDCSFPVAPCTTVGALTCYSFQFLFLLAGFYSIFPHFVRACVVSSFDGVSVLIRSLKPACRRFQLHVGWGVTRHSHNFPLLDRPFFLPVGEVHLSAHEVSAGRKSPSPLKFLLLYWSFARSLFKVIVVSPALSFPGRGAPCL